MTKNKLEKLGFKKIPGTEPGFHMYELNPATLRKPQTTKRGASKRTSEQAHELDK